MRRVRRSIRAISMEPRTQSSGYRIRRATRRGRKVRRRKWRALGPLIEAAMRRPRRLPNSFYPPSCDRFEMKEEAALLRLVRCYERSCLEVGRNSVLEHLQPILFGGRVHEAAPCPLIGVRISGSRRGGAVLNSWAARVRRRRVRAIMMSLGARCSSRWSTTGPMLSVIAMS
jgi:hypothetical protein